jgi:undecaprenyl phosphate N,N'-diacetylbacillosamine 1-phosphate transferase
LALVAVFTNKVSTTENNVKQFYLHFGKRVLDVSLVLCFIIFFSWLIVTIFLVYSIAYEFPILFLQPRIGKNQKVFTMVKFRTLSVDDQLTLNERRFLLGNFLRVTNLDELPQLWNVVKGEMSLVGPRPLPVEYASLFSDAQKKRHDVLPGITGLAQISGKNNIPWSKKFEYDLEYVRNVSFRMDCMILLKTLTLVLSMKRDVSLEENKFIG